MKKNLFFLVGILFAFHSLAQDNPVQAKLLARRAAISDAQRTLVELIHGIYLDSKTTVMDYIATNDVIKGQMEGLIRGAEIIQESWKDDIFKVIMRIDIEKVRKLVGKDFEYDSLFVEAVGKGAPRNNSSLPQMKITEDWHGRVVQGKGYGVKSTDPSISKPQNILMSERAAKLDAMRNLVSEIKGIHITAETTVKDLATQDDTILGNIDAFVRGARMVSSKQLPDGTCEVIVEINLDSLKSIIE